MKLISTGSCVLLASLWLAGCTADKSEPVRDVAYYEANDAERADKLAECANNPGTLAATPNCINARKADDNKVLSPKNRKMPTIR